MNAVWWNLLARLLAIAGTGALVWLVDDAVAALGLVAFLLLLMVLHHVRHLARLSKWLADPRPEAFPESSGMWEDVFAAFYHLLRRQRRSESRLTATLHDFQRAGMAMPDGLVVLDGSNRIEWCNPKSEQHFGLDAKRDIGQLVTYLVRQPSFAEVLGAGGYAEPLTLRAHGGDLVLSVLIVPYEANRKLIISRDVTDRERVETMRRDFVANVSHELRTPLTVIGGFLETIADMETPNPELIRRSVPLMSDQAKRMQTLVEDLLTLSRLESEGNYPAREEPVNVPDIARGLYHDALALSAGRHKVTLLLESAAWINGAEDDLRSAFGNLVSNAIRYTPAGGEVRLSWKASADDGAVFAVRDTGIGIEPQHLPRLTERFYRVDRSRSRETGGTGLGLAIVKHVVNRHTAKLDVSSEPGCGSCFSVIFPGSRIGAARGVSAAPNEARTA